MRLVNHQGDMVPITAHDVGNWRIQIGWRHATYRSCLVFINFRLRVQCAVKLACSKDELNISRSLCAGIFNQNTRSACRSRWHFEEELRGKVTRRDEMRIVVLREVVNDDISGLFRIGGIVGVRPASFVHNGVRRKNAGMEFIGNDCRHARIKPWINAGRDGTHLHVNLIGNSGSGAIVDREIAVVERKVDRSVVIRCGKARMIHDLNELFRRQRLVGNAHLVDEPLPPAVSCRVKCSDAKPVLACRPVCQAMAPRLAGPKHMINIDAHGRLIIGDGDMMPIPVGNIYSRRGQICHGRA